MNHLKLISKALKNQEQCITKFVFNSQLSKKTFTITKNMSRHNNFNTCFSSSRNTLIRINSKFYCRSIGNTVVLNGKNELKIKFEDKLYSIFFNDQDNLKNIEEKISSINEKIQSVELIPESSKTSINQEELNSKLIKNLINIPFKIVLNKHLSYTYIPGLFPQLFEEDIIANDLPSLNPDFLSNPESIKNLILLRLYNLKKEHSLDINKFEVEKTSLISKLNLKLEDREKFIVSLYNKQLCSETMVKNKLVFMSKIAVRLGLLFSISHFSAFYLLIYQFYAWDVIEPITYIVGNVYWIITLGYLAFSNRKLEFELLQYDSIKSMYLNKYSKRFGYNDEEKLLLEQELNIIRELKSGLAHI